MKKLKNIKNKNYNKFININIDLKKIKTILEYYS